MCQHLTAMRPNCYNGSMKTMVVKHRAERPAKAPTTGSKAAVMRCVASLRPMSASLLAAYRAVLADRRTLTR
jgi:CTP:molybdopterin cytidylyltransferase MocA